MTDNEYLDAVLREQTLVPGGAELTELERQRKNVVAILDKKVGNARPTVRKGGSLAKGTMNLEVYDLDLPTYFAYDEDGAGETLEEIYNTVADAMSEDYFVERRRSALRLRNNDGKVDTHIDLVPGRFFDASEGDAWIYQNNADKCRLKTNLDVHIVMDNYATHTTRPIRNWFAKRPRWHVHFTPTSASWINQVERFFALLTERALKRGVFRSVAELEKAIKAYIDATNTDPKPFRWTKTADDILASIQRFCLRTLAANA